MSVPSRAIFLSYARDDAAAARRIAEALRSSGLEVWFDENELRGGDTWDAKIRKQIDECALFVPLISQHTEARAKGYFRLEWKLAVDQTQMLAAGVPFIAPVAIDDTREDGAVVPPEFLRVQWMRLPGALPTPEFVAQMKRLLDAPKVADDVGRGRRTPPLSGAVSEPAGFGDPALQPSRRLLAAAWIGVVAVVVIGVAATYFSTRKPEPAARRSAPPTAEKAAPMSEARQLVAQARALYEPWDLATSDDFALAETLLKKAVELDPTDGEVWAAYAILSCGSFIHGHDSSDARRATARTQAENAIKLSPDSGQARFAYAFSLRFNPATQDEAIRLLRAEAARQPANRFVLIILGAALRRAGQLEQALVYLDKAAALAGNDPITQNNRGQVLWRMKRFDEAEAAFDEALAVAPNLVSANCFKLELLMDVRRDLPRAKAHLAKVPPAFFVNPRGALQAYLVAYYSREPAKALEALRHAKDDFDWSQPKALLTGRAHQLAGNKEAARTDFQAALKVVNDTLAAVPNNSILLYWKADILAALGDWTGVEPLLQEIRQRVSSGDRDLNERDVAGLLMQLDRREEALAALASYYGKRTTDYQGRNWLFYGDPVWDPLRGDPRFEALLKASEQKK